MKKQEQIIILEDNDISMFVIQGMLAPFEDSYSISYFSNADDAMEFLKKLPTASGLPISMFVSLGIILNNKEFIGLARKTITAESSHLFLLSSMDVEGERMKQFQEMGFRCCIEKPLTGEKFLQAMANPHSISEGLL